MSTFSHFLLVSDSPGDYWHQVLREALVALGSLHVVLESELVSFLQEQTYDIVIVDAGAISDTPLLVSCIRSQWPDVRVVVVTSSPHWRQAREILHAGAIDYIQKSWSKDDLFSAFQAMLDKTSPLWPG